jgi:hypothetical protein
MMEILLKRGEKRHMQAHGAMVTCLVIEIEVEAQHEDENRG